MIKRTLYFGNPAYLNIQLNQLIISVKDRDTKKSVPIEDIAIVILDHPQITITHTVIRKLLDNNVALLSCDQKHMPSGLMLPLEGNYTQSKVQQQQINASIILKKQLWQQTVTAKISNQKKLLMKLGLPYKKLEVLEKRVKSGDPTNVEGQAAAYYWPVLFENFIRDRYGLPPNNLLNYGYIILRSMVARALISSGMLPTLGIFHKNQYNAFGLADDIMEPFRPYIDFIVYQHHLQHPDEVFLDKAAKVALLNVCTTDAYFNKKRRPLMVGLSQTTRSLARCFSGERRKIVYPEFE